MKLEAYNQRLLAVLGSVALIFLVVALIAFISISILEARSYVDDVESGILSEEKIEELQKENKREQVISYGVPRLVDTLNSEYVIPVSHINLEEKEVIDRALNAVVSSSDSYYEMGDSRYSSQYYGSFNNLIIFNPDSGVSEKLFDKRINFKKFEIEYFEDDIILVLVASEKDTFKDGVINQRDFKSLYLYSFAKKELKKVGLEGMDVSGFRFFYNKKDLTVIFGVDKNKDGQFTEINEPTIIKKYEFISGALTDIVDVAIEAELQKTLDGTKE